MAKIAVYGGGFKPPTKGHFEVVKMALEQLKDINEFIILVGGGERNSITQSDSIKIWEIYKQYLPDKVKTQPSKAPIGDIFRLSKNNLDDTIYFILGAREGKEDDLIDAAKRTKSVEQKYPNIDVKMITTMNKNMSGTNARNAAKQSIDEFFNYLPDELKDREKEEVYNIVKNVITEIGDAGAKTYPFIADGEYDYSFTTDSGVQYLVWFEILADDKLNISFGIRNNKNRLSTKDTPNKGELYKVMATIAKITKEVVNYRQIKTITYSPSKKGNEDISSNQRNKLYQAFIKKALPNVRIEDDGETVFFHLNEIGDAGAKTYEYVSDHFRGLNIYNFKTDSDERYELTINPDDINDYLGNGYMIDFSVGTANNDAFTKVVNKGEMYKVMATITKITKEFYEKNKDKIDFFSYSPALTSKEKSFGEQRNRLYLAFIKKQMPNALIHREGEDIFIFPDGKKPEALNENQTTPNIDLQRHIRDITYYFIDQGLPVRPLPKVILKHGDSINASDFFGKTAYYEPETKTIVLYTEDRHPKDIARSYAHEMIHHIQNLEGRLGNMTTTDTNEDDELEGIEREAYQEGNIIFRNYSDREVKMGLSEEKKKDPFGLNAYALELARGLEEELTKKYQIYLDMDGVLVDFDGRFQEKFNMSPDAFRDKYGLDKFWDVITQEGVGYWRGMKWMPDGKALYNYVKDLKPKLLSAPSKDESSKIGKRMWVKSNLPGVPLLLRSADRKKEFASPNAVLIDDREKNIQQWEEAGGIGIHHTSTLNTIKKLKELNI